jgi:hypothetical protein
MVTVALLMRFTYTEILNTVQAFLTLYRDAQAAESDEALAPVSRRFADSISGVGLRVIVTLAGAKLASKLPKVPPGGLWGKVSPPRLSFAGSGSASAGGVGAVNRFFSQTLPQPAPPRSVPAGARGAVGSYVGGKVVTDADSISLLVVLAGTGAEAKAAATKAARTTGACREKESKGDAPGHHIATNKNSSSEDSGGPWTPRFENLFKKAGMTLADPANIVYLMGHQGPHPEEYHRVVFARLFVVFDTCKSPEDCKRMLINALDNLAAEICKPGSVLNKLLTRRQ